MSYLSTEVELMNAQTGSWPIDAVTDGKRHDFRVNCLELAQSLRELRVRVSAAVLVFSRIDETTVWGLCALPLNLYKSSVPVPRVRA